MSDIELPDLHQADLDDATVAALFRDLAACTNILEVQVKGGATARSAAKPDLDTARDLLMGGHVRAIQVRYAYQDAQWLDTLMRTPSGVRVVRMQA